MTKPREFTTMPARAIADTRLTALDLRCLGAIALHDGMSLVRGTGAGCYARSSVLAEMARTDISNFSKAVSRLIKLGYVVKEPQQTDRRRYTLRVIYGDDDSWRTDQQSSRPEPSEIVGELTNHRSEIVGEPTNDSPEIVGEAAIKNGSFSRKTGSQYISLNEEIDFGEPKEINSEESAQRAFSAPRHGCQPIGEIISSPSEKNGAETPADQQWKLTQHLPKDYDLLPDGAKVARFEEAFRKINRDPRKMDGGERETFANFLYEIAEVYHGENDAISNQAYRLWEEVVPF